MGMRVVAFPQGGTLRDKGTEELMWKAMDMGADVVGGMPFNEDSPVESARHIAIAFEIAKSFNADIDMHVDETDDPKARTLEMLAEQTMANGYEGRVTAGRTSALAASPAHYPRLLLDKGERAPLPIIHNPA